jgi:alcohol dehydrogenase class IV
VPPAIPVEPFRWQDGERLIVFGRGRLAEAGDLLDSEYVVLTTARAAPSATQLLDRAQAVHTVRTGRVDEIAGELRGEIEGELLVALGGGRVIDVAKALAAAAPPRRVAAIPTTLSGAEMTSGHRRVPGSPAGAPGVRPAIVLNDPALSASAPLEQLAESAGNALGHAIEGPATPRANPVAALAALAAVRLIGDGLASPPPGEDDRDALALGALLAGYVIDSTGYGLHHVLSQTLARFAGVGHGPANTIMLPHTTRALAARAPEWNARLTGALGSDPAELAVRVGQLAGVSRLRDAGVSEQQLDRCVQEASQRPDLAGTPPAAGAEELLSLYRAAY